MSTGRPDGGSFVTLTLAPRRSIWNSDDSETCSDALRGLSPVRCIRPRDHRSSRTLHKGLCCATRTSCRGHCKENGAFQSSRSPSTPACHSSCELEKYQCTVFLLKLFLRVTCVSLTSWGQIAFRTLNSCVCVCVCVCERKISFPRAVASFKSSGKETILTRALVSKWV